MSISNIEFGAADQVDDNEYVNYDGIFGMGYPAEEDQSFLDLLKDQGSIKQRIFCFIMYHDYDQKVVNGQNIGGELQIGGCEYQPTVYMPVDVSDLEHWGFTMSRITINRSDGSQFQACKGGCQAVMDTGTSLIIGPQSDIRRINKLLGAKLVSSNGSHQYEMSCNTKNLPNITFVMGGQPFILTPQDYIVRNDVRISIFGNEKCNF